MKDVVVGRCAASSAKGRSSTRICMRFGWAGRRVIGGQKILSGRVERTWVMRYEDSREGFSANARSEM